MKHNEKTVLKWLGVSEGGYVDHPKDPGGPTNHGVTQRTYDAWRRSQGATPISVQYLDREEADAIFVDQYFRPVWFNRLPSGLDYAMADFAVNSGPARAVKFLQRIVGAKQDGVMGVHTMAKVAESNAQNLIVVLCEDRFNFMKSLKTWRTFKNGWTARVMGRYEGVQTDDIGVIDRAVRMTRSDPVPAPVKATPHRAKPTGLWAAILAIFGVKQ